MVVVALYQGMMRSPTFNSLPLTSSNFMCMVVLSEVLDRWVDVTQHLTNHVHTMGYQGLPWIRCLLQVFVGEFHLLVELFAIVIDGSDLDAELGHVISQVLGMNRLAWHLT